MSAGVRRSFAGPGPGSLGRRVLVEYRLVVLPLLALLVLNAVVFVAIVRPLSERVANVEERTRAAERALRAARRDHAEATAALTARERAGERLATFNGAVLPANALAARQLLRTRPWEIAARMGLQPRDIQFAEVIPAADGLTRFRASMDLTGSYADVRAFVRQMELAPELVIIDDVQLQEAGRGDAPLQLRLGLSTYYRATTP